MTNARHSEWLGRTDGSSWDLQGSPADEQRFPVLRPMRGSALWRQSLQLTRSAHPPVQGHVGRWERDDCLPPSRISSGGEPAENESGIAMLGTCVDAYSRFGRDAFDLLMRHTAQTE
jgi:hypothetical protein